MKNIKIQKDGETVTVPVKVSAGTGQLNWYDAMWGLIMAVAPPIVTYLYDALMAFLEYKEVDLDWRTAVKYGISAGAIYIGKNFFQGKKIILSQKEYDKA